MLLFAATESIPVAVASCSVDSTEFILGVDLGRIQYIKWYCGVVVRRADVQLSGCEFEPYAFHNKNNVCDEGNGNSLTHFMKCTSPEAKSESYPWIY